MAAYTTIDNPGDFFNILLYTGTGSSNVLTGVGFQSDFIWTATRNEAEIRPINDSVNGINSYSRSNADDTLETTGSNITAQSSDGYSLEVAGRIRASGVVVAPITASAAATVTLDLKQSNFHMLTLARATTILAFADAEPGQRFLTRLTQDSTGSRAVPWPGGISWARAAGVGTPPPLSATAAHSTMYGFVCTSGVGTTMYYDGFIIASGIQGTST